MMRKGCLGLLTAVLLAVGCLGHPPEGAIPARILRWYDGDTAQLRLMGDLPTGVADSEVVRLLGINTPEVGEPLSDDATRFFRSLTMGKAVYVELNPYELRDDHSRLLAYIWVEVDGGWELVNEAILRAGLAKILVFYPEREGYYCRFLHGLALAQRDRRGLWAKFPVPVPLAEVEARPVTYVAEVATVLFVVDRVSSDRWGLSLWAAGSRYGFRALFNAGTCPVYWEEADRTAMDLVGRTVAVSGEILWDSYGGGPRIMVHFPDQLQLLGDKGGDP